MKDAVILREAEWDHELAKAAAEAAAAAVDLRCLRCDGVGAIDLAPWEEDVSDYISCPNCQGFGDIGEVIMDCEEEGCDYYIRHTPAGPPQLVCQRCQRTPSMELLLLLVQRAERSRVRNARKRAVVVKTVEVEDSIDAAVAEVESGPERPVSSNNWLTIYVNRKGERDKRKGRAGLVPIRGSYEDFVRRLSDAVAVTMTREGEGYTGVSYAGTIYRLLGFRLTVEYDPDHSLFADQERSFGRMVDLPRYLVRVLSR